MFRLIGRHFKEAFQGIFRHFAMALSSANAVTVTLVLVSLLTLIVGNVSQITKNLEENIQIYVKIDKELGLGVLYPSVEEVALQVAKRDKAHIAPTGAYAMNLLGLSTQVPMNVVFLTDGSPRKIRLGNNRIITFKHTVPKNLAFVNKTAQLATFALKEIGQSNVNEEHLKALKQVFASINEKSIEADYKLMPAWIRKIIKSFYE